ncbi:hypothetical protein WH279_08140 [Erwinia sp. MYb375]|uniref:hypothetical protein n=1 Tax=unclassified Erwinia TaxID=2622719 RepID=UPI0030A69599
MIFSINKHNYTPARKEVRLPETAGDMFLERGLKRVTPVLFTGKGISGRKKGRAVLPGLAHIIHNIYNLSALLLLVDAERKLSSVVNHASLLPDHCVFCWLIFNSLRYFFVY